jgi:hypothetical protein
MHYHKVPPPVLRVPYSSLTTSGLSWNPTTRKPPDQSPGPHAPNTHTHPGIWTETLLAKRGRAGGSAVPSGGE